MAQEIWVDVVSEHTGEVLEFYDTSESRFRDFYLERIEDEFFINRITFDPDRITVWVLD